MKFSKKLKNIKRTQVLTSNLLLDELIDKNLLKNLKKHFLKEGELVTTLVRFHIVKKDPKKKGVTQSINSIMLEHQSHTHTENKQVVISASTNRILEKFLK